MKIIKHDSFFCRDISNVLNAVPFQQRSEISLTLNTFPENGFIAYSLGSPVGIGCSDVTPGKKRTNIYIFVLTAYRRKGIGTELFSSIVKQGKSKGIQHFFCEINSKSESSFFVEKIGMNKKYSSDRMIFQGTVPQSTEMFEKYNDSMFYDFIRAEGEAFLPIRRRTGAEPLILQPTPNVRSFLAKARDDYFVLRKNGKIEAGAGCFKGEISDVFVSAGLQGQGIGRKLVEKCIVHSKNKGYDPVFLNVVSDNIPAVTLYRSLGFVVEKTSDFYVKTIDDNSIYS
ncbi:MAG: GNAT family N-acetyltransferase [Clostridia bacterium]|nr:GNAT family N-acetyltransferase [Clostridia bacterium]